MIIFTLPLPPPLSKCFANGHVHGRHMTKAYVNWNKAAGQEIMIQRVPQNTAIRSIEYPVQIVLKLNLVHGADLDNRSKASLDILKKMQVIEDDSVEYVGRLILDHDETWPSDKVIIEISTKEKPLGEIT